MKEELRIASHDGRKRDRTEDDYITKHDLEGILKGLKEEVAAGVKQTTTSAVNDLEQKFTSAMANALRRTDASYQDRFGMVEGEIKELKMRMERIEGWQPNTDRAVAEVRHAVALAESTANVQELLDVDDFERQPDLIVVKARIMDAVTPEAARVAVRGIVEEMGMKDDEMKIEGKDLDKGFTFRFAGCIAMAARRARKFMQLQRDGGEWRELVAKTPDGAESKMYVDVDKSKKQIKMEMMGRRLRKVLKEKFPARDFFNRRRDGTVSTDWTPLARVVVVGPEAHKIEWNMKLAGELGIDKDMVSEKVEASVPNRDGGVTWG